MDKNIFQIEYLEEIDSTNTELKRRARLGAPSGLVLVADGQTAGRGRMERSFLSPRGSGLYMSLLLRPVRLTEAGRMTTLTAVAVARALERVGVTAGIKWVNDLIAGGKKICGILAEAGSYEGEAFAVIGIGVNLAHTAFPEELAAIATSVEDQTGLVPDRNALAESILEEIAALDLAGEGSAPAMDEYRARCTLLGKPIRVFPFGGEPFDATALSVEDDGTLTVRPDAPDAPPVRLSSAEVSVREK